jgi:hypothetical protein
MTPFLLFSLIFLGIFSLPFLFLIIQLIRSIRAGIAERRKDASRR